MIAWLSDPANTKTLGLVLFFLAFVGIVFWVYGSKKRGQKLESYRNIPFQDDEADIKERKS